LIVSGFPLTIARKVLPSVARSIQITSLIEAGIIRPIMDRIFPFEATNEALADIETGRSKGKVVVKPRRRQVLSN